MSGQHALLAPSGFQALMLCPAKPAMERGLPDEASEYADEGTAAHYMAAECLRQEIPPVIGDVIAVHPEGECDWLDGMPNNRHPESRYFKVTDEMAEAVQVYIDTVRDYAGADGSVFIEQALPIGHITGEEGAEGTGDAIILRGDEIIVIDLKYGKGVEVSADDNPQLKLYGLGALEKFDIVGDIARVRTVICQPRVSTAPSEVAYPVAELVQWGLDVADPAAELAREIYIQDQNGLDVTGNCRPHEDACRFCKAKPTCPALAAKVQDALGREFTDLTTADEPEREAIVATSVATADAAGDLGARMDAVPLVEMWAKAIRGRVEKHLLDGKPVAGYKLVPGRKGARAWSDETAAETLLRKTFRLKVEQAYDLKLISPTTAEKVLKDKPKRWAKVQALISQSEGKPSVAPLTDKRPALEVKPIESEFTPITEAPATADDLV